MNLDDLKKEKDLYTTKVFWLGLEIALIFGIPGALGAILGTKLDNKYFGGGNKITIMILFGTFVFSWVITIMKYLSIQKKIKSINSQIKENKK